MSAIWGMLRFDARPIDPREVDRMGATMAARAPDGRHQFVDGGIVMGHGLLRVTEEDARDSQPLYDQSAGLVLVADCRLDNRVEIANAVGIDSASLHILPDSAVLLAAYRHWGQDCAAHLLGDFAFALWDARAARLLMACDHMGQRHLNYHLGEGFLAFASEPRALWAIADVPRAISEAGIGRHLVRDRPPSEGQTFFAGIKGLRGGERAVIDRSGALVLHRYWRPHAAPEHLGQNEAYYVDAYRRVLTAAVECRVNRAAAPVALAFSGGFDSAAIAALAAPAMQAQGRRLLALASVMPMDATVAQDARAMVDCCARAMPHLDVRYVTREALDPFTNLDELMPLRNGPPLILDYVSHELCRIAAAQGARLMLDGHGGNQTLNPRGGGAIAFFISRGQFGRAIRELAAYRRRYRAPILAILRNRVLPHLLPRPFRALIGAVRRRRMPADLSSAIQPEFARRLIAEGSLSSDALEKHALFQDSMRSRMVRALDRAQSRLCISRSDELGASHGMDSARPFFDKRVVELALAIPESLYVKDGRNRYLAIQALGDLYPADFRDRIEQNDSWVPDIDTVIREMDDRLDSEAERMSENDRLASIVDFDRARAQLKAKDETATLLAVRALLLARYVAWFERTNH